jgi:hypothetical protein
MTLPRLDNLVTTGKLKLEPPARAEIEGLIRSGTARIKDAEVATLSLASRFDLAYNAAHALSLAALRHHGYPSENRYIVFQVLQDTLQLPAAQWRVLEQAHSRRNRAEYEGDVDLEESFVASVVRVVREIEKRVTTLDLTSLP